MPHLKETVQDSLNFAGEINRINARSVLKCEMERGIPVGYIM